MEYQEVYKNQFRLRLQRYKPTNASEGKTIGKPSHLTFSQVGNLVMIR
jgi:hypothetical protein